MAAFAAVGNSKVNIIPKVCGRRKIARIGGSGVMAHDAFSQGWNMVGFLAYSPDRNIVGIATVAGLAIGADTAMGKVGCLLERHINIRIVVALETVVIR